ncbi:MAG: hypothetical protein PVG99_11230 [Desulfobacteraceae bacterium]|jgi:hypothetical protein
MEKWIEQGKKIRALVNTATFPVAVSFLQDASQIPASDIFKSEKLQRLKKR